ncbi:unnamed protein product [Cylicostephanus goldi]|uniref:Chitin-binding type-2 domain-containing protein n=1 Tax=Cylicostephanus goldi TaxID=71465 RepID=A0A3P6SXG8_CYLGO|nr:unnamed protein product [Cylicostephanus goldi]
MNKLRCDYVESCAAEAAGMTTTAPVRVPVGVTAVSCDGKEKGYYSNGCTPNYVFCNEGIATAMRCPSSLVFNQKKGLCDYPEECLGEISVPTAEALTQPQQHSTSPQSQTVVR